MTIKSDKWIRRMALEQRMIEPFEAQQIKELGGRRVVSYGTSSYGYDIRCSTEFLRPGAHGGVLPHPAQRAHHLLGEIHLRALRHHRQRDAPRAGVGGARDAGVL